MTDNIIKSIVEGVCPHCAKTIYIESQFHPATVGEVFTEAKMNDAKRDCAERIESLAIDDGKKASVLKWLNDPATIFAPNEVENIILSLLKPEE